MFCVQRGKGWLRLTPRPLSLSPCVSLYPIAGIQVDGAGTGNPWSTKKKHISDRRCTWWLVTRKRPFNLVDDPEFRSYNLEITHGKYEGPRTNTVNRHVLQMVAAGMSNNTEVSKNLAAQGFRPSMASDIWSDSHCSLMGTILYYISDDWLTLDSMLIGATGFSGERHTGEAIRLQTIFTVYASLSRCMLV